MSEFGSKRAEKDASLRLLFGRIEVVTKGGDPANTSDDVLWQQGNDFYENHKAAAERARAESPPLNTGGVAIGGALEQAS